MSIQIVKQKFNNACAVSRIKQVKTQSLEAQHFKNKLDILTTQMFGLTSSNLNIDAKAEYLRGRSLADVIIELQIDLL